MSAELDQHIADLIATAKRRKADAMQTLADIAGSATRLPSRGPIQFNGRACIRWHFWQGARERHQKLGRLIKELIALQRMLGKEGGVSAKKKAKPSPRPCTTCAGSGWLRSGVGHYGEQLGGCKDVMSRCGHCLGLGYLEQGEGTE